MLVQVVLELSDELLNSLKKIYPGLTTEALIKKILEDYSSRVSHKQVTYDEALSSIQRVLRSATDTINTYSSLLTELRDRLVEIREVLDNLSSKIDELPSKITVQQAPVEATQERAREKITAIEVLKKQKAIYEADIAKKIRNRDAFFDRLERDGAVVLSLKDQRVAVDTEFWTQFVNKVESLTTDKDSEIAKVLDKQEITLLKKLVESAIAYYDRSKKKWVIKI